MDEAIPKFERSLEHALMLSQAVVSCGKRNARVFRSKLLRKQASSFFSARLSCLERTRGNYLVDSTEFIFRRYPLGLNVISAFNV